MIREKGKRARVSNSEIPGPGFRHCVSQRFRVAVKRQARRTDRRVGKRMLVVALSS